MMSENVSSSSTAAPPRLQQVGSLPISPLVLLLVARQPPLPSPTLPALTPHPPSLPSLPLRSSIHPTPPPLCHPHAARAYIDALTSIESTRSDRSPNLSPDRAPRFRRISKNTLGGYHLDRAKRFCSFSVEFADRP